MIECLNANQCPESAVLQGMGITFALSDKPENGTTRIKTSTLVEIGIVAGVVLGSVGFMLLLLLYLRRKNDDAIANPGAHLPPGYSLAPPPSYDDDPMTQ